MQFITTGNRIMTENFTVGLFYTITFLNGNYLACSCNGIGDNFVSFLCTEPTMQFILDLTTAETVDTIELYGGGAGTMNYNELENKPSINGEPLVGNLTTTDLHIRTVPPIDTTDNNKVLTASYAGGVTSYSWQTVPTGTTNYNDLTNKPEINGHVLSGNQLSSQLGLATAAQGALADTAVQPAALANYQPLIDSAHKLSSDLVDDTDHTNKFATQTQLDQIETNKNNILTCKEFTDNAYIDSNRKLYISSTEPLNPPIDSTWINGKTIKSADSNPLNLAPNMTEWSYGYYSSSGSYDNLHPNGEKTTNDYIPVIGGEQYTYSCVDGFPTSTWCAINTFDSSYNFIARLAYTNSSGTNVTLGNNVAYIKLSFRTYDINNLIPIFNEGSTAVAYYVWQ